MEDRKNIFILRIITLLVFIIISNPLIAQSTQQLPKAFSLQLGNSLGLHDLNEHMQIPCIVSSKSSNVINPFELQSWSSKPGNAGRHRSLYETRIILASFVKPESLPVVSLRIQDDDPDSKSNEDESFFKSDLFYFIGAAALATTAYFIWDNNDKTVSKKTFGTPPKP